MHEDKRRTTIKDWAVDDRPREKMLLKGASALSNAELIAILIRLGSNTESAVELSRQILQTANNNLIELSKQSVEQLTKIKGIGEAKALSIKAALELGHRRRLSETSVKPTIISSKQSFEIIHPILSDLQYEQFWALLLNNANKFIKTIMISDGGTAASVVDPKKLFRLAIENNATAMILAHNHPSGQLRPSTSDSEITKKLVEGGQLLGIRVLDHLIVSSEKYISFADEGLMPF